jgi:hypothetical protein
MNFNFEEYDVSVGPYKEAINMRSRSIISLALSLLALAAAGCGLSPLSRTKINMFEGTAADDFARQVKAKLAVDDLKTKRIEIHRDQMSIVVQDPANPKNADEYIWDRDGFKGPKPVEALVVGSQEFTADKTLLFPLKDVPLNLVPEVCRKAEDHAQIEGGKCDLISVDWQSPRWTRTKEENDRIRKEKDKEREKKMRSGNYNAWKEMTSAPSDLVVTWRIYIKGPRATKDFWVDAKGNIFDYQ